MNSNLLKICLASLLALSFTACGDDDNGDNNGGNGGETISCTAGEKKCSPDNKSTLVCNAAGNAWTKGEDCAFGCENNACKSDPNGGGKEPICTPNSIECNNGKLLKCNADGSAIDEEKCDYGCEKGQTTCNTEKCTTGAIKCNDDNTAALTCNANGTWDEEACTYGCNSGACVQIESLKACDPEVLAECQTKFGDDVTCLVDEGIAECVEKCTNLGDKFEECDEDYWDIAVYMCTPIGDDGTGTWYYVNSIEECEFGCNDDLTACGEKLVSDQGEKCDETRADRCDGSILSSCYNGNVVAGNCARLDKDFVCAIFEDEANCNKPCTVEDANRNGCYEEDGDDYAVSYICTKADDGQLYDVMQTAPGTYELCEHGCKDGACLKLVADEGDECTADERADRCDGNILSYCEDYDGVGVVQAIECSKGGKTCIELDNDGSVWADCFKDTDTCTADSTVCATKYDIDVLTTSVCKPSKDDPTKKYIIKKNEACPSGACADATSCKPPLVEDQGKDCKPENRKYTCDDDKKILSYCGSSNKVVASECDEDTVCAVSTDGKSGKCFAEADKCTEKDAESKACETQGEKVYAVNTICTETSEGLYAISTSEECAHGCVDDACVKLVDDEGDTCTAETRADACSDDGTILSWCKSGAVFAKTCDEGKSCIMLNDGYADCFSDEKQCDTVGATENKCDNSLASYGLVISETRVCVAATGDSGKNYWKEGLEFCKSTCVEATGLCKE